MSLIVIIIPNGNIKFKVSASQTCQYKKQYYDFKTNQLDDFVCSESTEDTDSEFCIFHDRCYIKNENYEKHTKKIAEKFKKTLSKYRSKKHPLEFIGYCLPDISFPYEQFTEVLYFNQATFYGLANFGVATFSDKAFFTGARFSNEVYFANAIFFKQARFTEATFSDKAYFSYATFFSADFSGVTFSNEANFGVATFSNEANFGVATFLGKAYFSGSFNSLTFFNYTIFKEPSSVTFGILDTPFDMSNVSFSDSDITRIRFSDKVTWGGDDKFTIIEEKWLIEEMEHRKKDKSKSKTLLHGGRVIRVSPELVLSVYRNLRENYEFRLRYDDAVFPNKPRQIRSAE